MWCLSPVATWVHLKIDRNLPQSKGAAKMLKDGSVPDSSSLWRPNRKEQMLGKDPAVVEVAEQFAFDGCHNTLKGIMYQSIQVMG